MKKKISKIAGLVLAATLILAGCSTGGNENEPSSSGKIDSSVFNVPFSDAINASKSFVNESIKNSNSRAAFIELSEEDQWQGYINNQYGNNWNVPSNIYGTSYTPAENELKLKKTSGTEDLGTLVELIHHKDENDHFVKAVFTYKGYDYYVLDKGNYTVLCSSDDLDHIFLDQMDYIDTKNFSNFKIWVWNEDKTARNGNLGYANTCKNVKMLDGSYATVTTAGYNYYFYGFRVWIKETPAPDPAEELPNFLTYETSGTYKDFIKLDFSGYKEQLEKSNEMYIFRKTQNTSWEQAASMFVTGEDENIVNLGTVPNIVDYYTNADTTYYYYLKFYGDDFNDRTTAFSIDAKAGLGEITITPGNATYNSETGDFVFSENPVVTYSEIPNGDYQSNFTLFYTNNFSIYLNNLPAQGEATNLKTTNNINNYSGKTLKPNYYWFQSSTYPSGLQIRYTKMFTNMSNLPDITFPANISFYNPTQNAISLYDSSNNVIATVEPQNSITKEITLNVPFHFNDGERVVTINPFKSSNFILKLNEPVEGVKYLCLNQNKRTDLRKDNSSSYWELCLFEVVDSTADYSYKYSDNVYIRSYPSAFLWINNKDFVKNQLGQELTFSNSLFSMFTVKDEWLDWGWSSKINNTWYENILPTMVLNINE